MIKYGSPSLDELLHDEPGTAYEEHKGGGQLTSVGHLPLSFVHAAHAHKQRSRPAMTTTSQLITRLYGLEKRLRLEPGELVGDLIR